MGGSIHVTMNEGEQPVFQHKFLETYNLPKLNEEKMKSVKQIKNKEFESVIENLNKVVQDQVSSCINSTKYSKKNINPS